MNKQNINIVKLRDAAQIPTKGSIEAGGWDVYAAEIQKVYDDLYIVYLGLAMQPPKGFKITLVPRSSITKTRWYLPNSPGLGDADYMGEYQFRFRCVPTFKVLDGMVFPACDDFPFKIGDRVGQMYLEEVIDINFNEVDKIEETERGEGGFGSTGV